MSKDNPVYSIKECLENNKLINTILTIQGWVKTRRDSKAGISFLSIHDGSCFNPIQVVASESLPNYKEEILHATAGTAVSVTGKLILSEGKGQTCEIQADSVNIIGVIEEPETYPIQAKRHSLEFLREVSHLRVRTNTISAVTRIRHCVSQAIHKFFDERGFFWIHTPIITGSDCEGAGELFRVSTLDLLNIPKTADDQIDFNKDFFGREAFLTVSGQLNAEAYCLAMSKVYTFGPTFRAENSNTSRHLAEFWMVEPEIAFAGLLDICNLSQDLLKFVCTTVLNKHSDDMEFFNQFIMPGCITRLQDLIASDFDMITYTNAIQILEKAPVKFEFPVAFGLDLQSEHERYLTETVFKKPIIITDFPKSIKSFYMRVNEDNTTVAAMDVLVPGIGEIIGGSQREERLEILDERMQASNMDFTKYQWYRDLRRYGSAPHAGFGMGLERLIGYITGLHNVRDVIAFPRTPGHAEY